MSDHLQSAPDAAPEEAAGPPSPRGLSGAARTLLVGVAVAVAIAVGAMVATVAVRDQAAPPGDASTAGPGRLGDRVPPTMQAPLPEVALDGFGDGAPPVELASYRGQPLVVNFWATWCAPCVEEMPMFSQVAAEVASDVTFLGVNVQDSPLNAEPFAERLGISYDLAVDPRGELYAAVQGFGMPTTLFVDAEGTIRYRHTGALDEGQLRELLADVLGVPA